MSNCMTCNAVLRYEEGCGSEDLQRHKKRCRPCSISIARMQVRAIYQELRARAAAPGGAVNADKTNPKRWYCPTCAIFTGASGPCVKCGSSATLRGIFDK